MGITPSRLPTQDDGLCEAVMEAARQRSFEFLESARPRPGLLLDTAAWSVRAALAAAPTVLVYSAWANMELGADDPTTARELF